MPKYNRGLLVGRAWYTLIDELADLAVSARTSFLGRAYLRTCARACVPLHNPRTWYAPKPPDLPPVHQGTLLCVCLSTLIAVPRHKMASF